jgi:anaerobic ribonucleoside-triphosphate reductase activating protein
MKIASTQYTLKTKSFEIYLSGCAGNPKCSGCYSPELWDFNFGQDVSSEFIAKSIKKILRFNSIIENIFILGGDPLDQPTEEITSLAKNFLPIDKKMWIFTRKEIEEIPVEIKNIFDYIKTGRYIPELISDNNVQYGIKLATSNQKIHKKGVDY